MVLRDLEAVPAHLRAVRVREKHGPQRFAKLSGRHHVGLSDDRVGIENPTLSGPRSQVTRSSEELDVASPVGPGVHEVRHEANLLAPKTMKL